MKVSNITGTIFDYEIIMELAKRQKTKVSDLVALAPVNDPFYVTPGQREAAEWFVARWRELGLNRRPLAPHSLFIGQPIAARQAAQRE